MVQQTSKHETACAFCWSADVDIRCRHKHGSPAVHTRKKGVRGNLAECTSGTAGWRGKAVTAGRLATGPISESDSQRVRGEGGIRL